MSKILTDEHEDQRIYAWHKVVDHSFFAECFDTEGTLLDAMIEKLDRVHEYLVAVDEYDEPTERDE